MRILLVEDNPMNVELETDLLELAGHQVCPAASGEEALRLARSETFDLILMDVSLPGMDGLAVTRALKEHNGTAGVPVVAVTAHAMKGDEERILAAGCAGYLTKPINTRTFAQQVASFLFIEPGR
jgi:CheY-like chemotaxis protein